MTSTGLIVAAAVLVIGTVVGLWRRRTDGRLRSAGASAGSQISEPAVPEAPPRELVASDEGALPIVGVPQPAGAGGTTGSDDPPSAGADPSAAGQRLDAVLLTTLGVGPAEATLLQFSSAFCAPCRALRRVSSEVAALLPGVQHVEVDAESHLDAVRALGIWRTPTLLVLDADGRVTKRATGVPGKPQLIAVLGDILPGT